MNLNGFFIVSKHKRKCNVLMPTVSEDDNQKNYFVYVQDLL